MPRGWSWSGLGGESYLKSSGFRGILFLYFVFIFCLYFGLHAIDVTVSRIFFILTEKYSAEEIKIRHDDIRQTANAATTVLTAAARTSSMVPTPSINGMRSST